MRTLTLLSIILFATAGFGADVYRSVAGDGTVLYADRPLSDTAEVIYVAVRQPVDPQAEPAADAASAATQNQVTPRDPDEMTNEQIAQRIVENCELAKRQLAVVESTDELSRTLPDGTMRALTDEEIAAVRERAAAEADEWCNPP